MCAQLMIFGWLYGVLPCDFTWSKKSNVLPCSKLLQTMGVESLVSAVLRRRLLQNFEAWNQTNHARNTTSHGSTAVAPLSGSAAWSNDETKRIRRVSVRNLLFFFISSNLKLKLQIFFWSPFSSIITNYYYYIYAIIIIYAAGGNQTPSKG